LHSAAKAACIGAMKTLAALIFLIVASLPAQELHVNTLMTTFSPKLRKLLASHLDAFTVMSNSTSLAFHTNTVSLTYFYCQDDSVPRASHYYPQTAGMADAVLLIRENQEPWDEFTSIIYELLNSKNQPRFQKVFEKAKAGSISKKEFAIEICRIEFDADLAMREILRGMKLTKKEKSQSYFYKRITDCPTDFEEHFAYQRKVSPKRDPIKEYESSYDELQGSKN
jgi:hypothetical protein